MSVHATAYDSIGTYHVAMEVKGTPRGIKLFNAFLLTVDSEVEGEFTNSPKCSKCGGYKWNNPIFNWETLKDAFFQFRKEARLEDDLTSIHVYHFARASKCEEGKV